MRKFLNIFFDKSMPKFLIFLRNSIAVGIIFIVVSLFIMFLNLSSTSLIVTSVVSVALVLIFSVFMTREFLLKVNSAKELELRPFVSLSLAETRYLDEISISLLMKNYGKTPAHNILVTIDKCNFGKNPCSTKNVGSLGSSERRKVRFVLPLSYEATKFSPNTLKDIAIKIEYSDSAGKLHSNRVVINGTK